MVPAGGVIALLLSPALLLHVALDSCNVNAIAQILNETATPAKALVVAATTQLLCERLCYAKAGIRFQVSNHLGLGHIQNEVSTCA
eukprot:1070326-Amphidinium_carterae.1